MRRINSGCIDLIYLDPPFNSNADYAAPVGSEAAGAEFRDTWTLTDLDVAWVGLIVDQYPSLHRALLSAPSDSMKSYLVYMSVRLLEMHRILKDTGTIYLHCDPTASHYLKIVMDSIFGLSNFRNEVVWHYGKMSNATRNFPSNHDTILRYSKTDDYTFNPIKGADSEYSHRFKKYLDGNKVIYGKVKHLTDQLIAGRCKKVEKSLGRKLLDTDVLFDFDVEFKNQSDVIYVPIIKGNSKERTGYPTQKPIALLDKIIQASSNIGDLVFDPFCGCATTMVAADRLQRKWAGIDLSERAAELVQIRIRKDQPAMFHNIIHRTDLPQRTDLEDIQDPRFYKEYLYGKQKGYCAGCNTHFEDRNLEVDHILAKSKGGTDCRENLQLLCGSCNRVKGDRGMNYLISTLSMHKLGDIYT